MLVAWYILSHKKCIKKNQTTNIDIKDNTPEDDEKQCVDISGKCMSACFSGA